LLKRAALAVLLLIASNAFAATFTVTNSAASGPGTLEQAITDANASPGLDHIRFSVPTANVALSMPAITDVIEIDGTTPTALFDNKVTIQGTLLDCNRAFVLKTGSSGSSIRNVRLSDFCEGIRIDPSVTGVSVTTSVMSTLITNGDDGVFRGDEIFLATLLGDRNQVLGSTIVTLRAFFADDNRIGTATEGNNITVLQLQSSAGTIVEGNTFNHQTPVVTPAAILVSNALPPAATGSMIRQNAISNYSTGIIVYPGGGSILPPTGITITQNNTFSVPIPIDLGNDGPTPNDPAPDADLGANRLQNFPVLTSAVIQPGGTTVSGTLSSAPLTTYRIEVFSNPPAPDTSAVFIGSFNVTTDATGNAAFTNSVVGSPSADYFVSATATNLTTGDTSEVGAQVAADAPGSLAFALTSIIVDEASGTATLTVNRFGGSEGTVTLAYATENGSATAPADFTATSGVLTFGPGVVTRDIVIPIVNDALVEPAESFGVRISAPTGGATIIGLTAATVTIASQLPTSSIPTMSQWALLALALTVCGVALLRMR